MYLLVSENWKLGRYTWLVHIWTDFRIKGVNLIPNIINLINKSFSSRLFEQLYLYQLLKDLISGKTSSVSIVFLNISKLWGHKTSRFHYVIVFLENLVDIVVSVVILVYLIALEGLKHRLLLIHKLLDSWKTVLVLFFIVFAHECSGDDQALPIQSYLVVSDLSFFRIQDIILAGFEYDVRLSHDLVLRESIFILRLNTFGLFQENQGSSLDISDMLPSGLELSIEVQLMLLDNDIRQRIVALSYVEYLGSLPLLFYFTQTNPRPNLMVIFKVSLILHHDSKHVFFTYTIARDILFGYPF